MAQNSKPRPNKKGGGKSVGAAPGTFSWMFVIGVMVGILAILIGFAAVAWRTQSGKHTLPTVWHRQANALGRISDPKELLSKMRKSGAVVNPALEIRDADGYRSLIANAKIEAGGTIMSIPESMVIHGGLHRDVQQRAIEAVMKRNNLGSSEGNLSTALEGVETPEGLVLTLLIEKYRGDASPFAAYIANLPEHPMSLVVYPEEIKAVLMRLVYFLGEGGLLGAVDAVKEYAAEFLSPPPTDDEIKWAVAIVATRATASFEPHVTSLVPLYDFINHGEPPEPVVKCNVSGYMSKSLKCKSPQIRSGSEVLFKYGDHLVVHFLANYGFRPKKRKLLRQVSMNYPVEIPAKYNCNNNKQISFPQEPTKDNIWAAIRCFRISQLRTLKNGPEVQEFASSHGWFEKPFSSLPQKREAVGQIDDEKAYFLMVMEAKMLKILPEIIEKQAWHDSDAITPLLEEMRARKPSWELRFQKLADEVEDEVRLDKMAIDKTMSVIQELRDSLAWTDVSSQ